jgi:two-component sensor histidine kinase
MLMTQEIDGEGLKVREINHRMMNMLAMLLACFRRDFSPFDDRGFRSAVTKFEGQIVAASELLRAISSAPAADGVAIDVYTERLTRALSRAILKPASIICEIYSDQGQLPANVCERLGLIIVELIFNASKYAFEDRIGGVVRVEMTRSGDCWRCSVSDNGVGMDVEERGTGLGIVEALARSLKGRLLIRSSASGTWACVVLPDQSMPRNQDSEQGATLASQMPTEAPRRNYQSDRFDTGFAFETPAMVFDAGNDLSFRRLTPHSRQMEGTAAEYNAR